MRAIKPAVGNAVDIAGSVVRVGIAVGISAMVMFESSGMAHADTRAVKFLLGVICAVTLLGMLIAGRVVSQRRTASYQQGHHYAMQQAYPEPIADVNEFEHGSIEALHRMEYQG